ncbi:class D sortase [Mesobacillus foraminis]|uniref:Sortase A n=1 Tax=Mesobacillus foraminis TaxID=279826 RepID=A0A4R2BIA0_9BACI|nr:class D sortase [Mesobacillus foraminis]TCN26867.1 sortase A [Mesobacillus foraminis]
MIKKHRLVVFAGMVLLAAGVYLLAANLLPLMKGNTAERTTSAQAEKQEEPKEAEVPVKTAATTEKALYSERPEKGEEFGTLSIPKISASLPIFHGADEEELEKGVGHFAGSVLPGEDDNSVLSGHRDTVFRQLGQVGKGDLLIVSTPAGEFTYKVKKVRIVDADNRTVIVPRPRATLTVTTCYPFNYIGDAPERYVLVADLYETKLADS